MYNALQGEQDKAMSISLLQDDKSIHCKLELDSKAKAIKLSTGSATVQTKEVFCLILFPLITLFPKEW
jgi:hypothetical protein